SHMEEELDQIEQGKIQRNTVLDEFYGGFQQALQKAEIEMEAVKGTDTGEKCPKCGRPLVKRFSKKTGTSFLGCSGYKKLAPGTAPRPDDCDYTQPIGGEPRATPTVTDHTCPTCGKPMVQRMGSRGPFLGCSGYSEGCRTTMNIGPDGKPVLSAQ